jgi:hypothetical protein
MKVCVMCRQDFALDEAHTTSTIHATAYMAPWCEACLRANAEIPTWRASRGPVNEARAILRKHGKTFITPPDFN